MTISTAAPYIMGRTERERRRLSLQGCILKPVTARSLRSAGLTSGTRVLDLGCGIGDVTFAAAEIVGERGCVVGIDVDEQAIHTARKRAVAAGISQVLFHNADLFSYRPDGPFDAVVARHVLIHASDPAAMVRHAAAFLPAGGILAFEEYDLSFWPAGFPVVALAANLQWALVELFRATTPHANIGMRLPRLLHEAGLGTVRSSAECLIEGGPDTLFYEWLAQTVHSVFPAVEKLGFGPVAGDLETLAQRLREHTMEAGASLTTPLIVSASGVKRA